MVNQTSLQDCLSRASMIVCDWNGTIVDDAGRALHATNAALEHVGLAAIDAQAFRQSFRLPMDHFMRHLGVGEHDITNALAIWNARMRAEPSRLHGGVVSFLQTAQKLGVPIGIVSAAHASVVETDARFLGIAKLLAFVRGSVSSKATEIARLRQESGGQVIYVGDTEYDISEALAAGAIAIGFTGGYRPASALQSAAPHVLLDDFCELSAALSGHSSALVAD